MVRELGLFEVTHIIRALLQGPTTWEETKRHFVSQRVTMTTSHSKVTHQPEYNMPFEHHGEGVWSFRGHAQHLCGPS
eukprot:2093222-Prymnesium_polylepis.1